MLEAAGVLCAIDPADIDETRVKEQMQKMGADAGETAQALADAKALAVSKRHPGAHVLGADQMLECEGVWFDKPKDRAQARAQLQRLRGRAHRLISAASIALNNKVIWRSLNDAHLVMRPFSDSFLEAHLDREGDNALSSVGAYRVEGPSVQLFSRIAGDYCTILGMPLLPLLDFLRGQGVLET